jgi:Tol biopolymer transport system component
MPWLIAVSRIGNIAPPFENQGPWYTNQFDAQFGLHGELPIVPKLKALPSRVRADGPILPTWARYQADSNEAGRVFDARLKYLEPTPKLDVVGTQVPSYWKLTEVQWANETEGQGYILVKAMDEQGQPLEGATFQVARADAIDTAVTKGGADQYWGNYLMTAPLGTYRVSMAEGNLPSDGLSQVGRGKEEKPSAFDNTSFSLTFQRTTPSPLVDQIFTLPSGFGGHGLAFHPNGQQFAVGGYQAIQLWDIATKQIKQNFMGHESWVWAVAFSPDGRMVASASWDKTVRLWEVTTGKMLRQWTGHNSWVSSVAFSADNSTVASGGADKTVRVWDVQSERELRILTGHEFHVWAVAFSPDQQTLASSSGDKTVRLWDLFSGKETQQFADNQAAMLSVAFSPDGKLLAAGGADGIIKLWEMATGQLKQTLSAPMQAVHSLAFSPSGQTLAASSLDKQVRLWRVVEGQMIRQWTGHTDVVRRVAFSADGRMVASLGADETVRLWVV